MTRFVWAGESHLLVEFGKELSIADNHRVHSLMASLTDNPPAGYREAIPAYSSLLISFDPFAMAGDDLVAHCRRLIEGLTSPGDEPGLIVDVPVLYGEEWGLDLADVARECGLSVAEVVRLHTERNYLIYMMGFMPGYPYLGGLNEKLRVPRLSNPRTRVLSGSVAIAEDLTGIYSVDSPGGWRILGRTPLRLFSPHISPPALFKAGQYLRFRSIDEAEYRRISELVQAGSYELQTWQLAEGGGQHGH